MRVARSSRRPVLRRRRPSPPRAGSTSPPHGSSVIAAITPRTRPPPARGRRDHLVRRRTSGRPAPARPRRPRRRATPPPRSYGVGASPSGRSMRDDVVRARRVVAGAMIVVGNVVRTRRDPVERTDDPRVVDQGLEGGDAWHPSCIAGDDRRGLRRLPLRPGRGAVPGRRARSTARARRSLALRTMGKRVAFVTNNSARTPAEVAAHLAGRRRGARRRTRSRPPPSRPPTYAAPRGVPQRVRDRRRAGSARRSPTRGSGIEEDDGRGRRRGRRLGSRGATTTTCAGRRRRAARRRVHRVEPRHLLPGPGRDPVAGRGRARRRGRGDHRRRAHVVIGKPNEPILRAALARAGGGRPAPDRGPARHRHRGRATAGLVLDAGPHRYLTREDVRAAGVDAHLRRGRPRRPVRLKTSREPGAMLVAPTTEVRSR